MGLFQYSVLHNCGLVFTTSFFGTVLGLSLLHALCCEMQLPVSTVYAFYNRSDFVAFHLDCTWRFSLRCRIDV